MIVVEKVQFDEQIPVANNGDACSHEERLNTIQPLANRSRFLRLLTQGSLDVEPLTHAASTPTLEDVFVPQGSTLGELNPWRRMGRAIRNNLRYWGDKIIALESKAHGQGAWTVHFLPQPRFAEASNFQLLQAANRVTLTQTDPTNAQSVWIPLPQINYGKTAYITNVQLLVRGVSHGSMPTVMPALTLLGLDLDFSVDTLGTASDPSPDVATYDLQHWVNIPGLTPVLVGGYPGLELKLTGEDSSSGGFQCLAGSVTVTPA